MNFITSEQFLYQSEKVQSELIKWWKPQIGDLYTCSNSNYVKVIDEDVLAEYEINGSLTETIYCFNSKEDIVLPLLQIHHLIRFIKYKGHTYEIFKHADGEHSVNIYSYGCCKLCIDNIKLLQALWEITIKLIENK